MRISAVSGAGYTGNNSHGKRMDSKLNSPSFGRIYFPDKEIYKALFTDIRQGEGRIMHYLFEGKSRINGLLRRFYNDTRDVLVRKRVDGKLEAHTLTDCGPENPLAKTYVHGQVPGSGGYISHDETFLEQAVVGNQSEYSRYAHHIKPDGTVILEHPRLDLNPKWLNNRKLLDQVLYHDYL